MAEPLLTLCTVAYNAADAVALLWESFQATQPGIAARLYAEDRGSTDGAAEYLRLHAHHYQTGENSVGHGVTLDLLCHRVETPYTLVCDTDVEHREAWVAAAIQQIERHGLLCVTPPALYPLGTAQVCGWELGGQPRIDPCCTLFDSRRLKRLLWHATWATVCEFDRHRWYDVGGDLYRAAILAGERVCPAPWLWQRITHYGRVSALWREDADAALREELRPVYAQIGERLRRLRGG